MQPGLYDISGKLIYTWEELRINNLVYVKDYILTIVSFELNKINNGNNILILPDCIDRINDKTFENVSLYKLIIPDNIIVDACAFDKNKIEYFETSDKNSKYSTQNGILYNKDKTVLLSYPGRKPDDKCIIDNVNIIADSAFYYNKIIKEIEITDNIKEIKAYAFANTNINKITIKGANIIYSNAFANLNIKKLILSNNIKQFFGPILSNSKVNKLFFKGSYEQFTEINGWEMLFANNNLIIQDIQFEKTLEELIDEGKTFLEANKIIKEQQKIR